MAFRVGDFGVEFRWLSETLYGLWGRLFPLGVGFAAENAYYCLSPLPTRLLVVLEGRDSHTVSIIHSRTPGLKAHPAFLQFRLYR